MFWKRINISTHKTTNWLELHKAQTRMLKPVCTSVWQFHSLEFTNDIIEWESAAHITHPSSTEGTAIHCGLKSCKWKCHWSTAHIKKKISKSLVEILWYGRMLWWWNYMSMVYKVQPGIKINPKKLRTRMRGIHTCESKIEEQKNLKERVDRVRT